MGLLRASEIGVYLFCARAWWYRRQGVAPLNQAEMAAGWSRHQHHGRQVLAAGLLRALAWVLLLTSLVLLTAYCALHLL